MPGDRPMLRTTHTLSELEVSAAAYDEIAAKLRKAEYDHAFGPDGMIDMSGIGLTRAPHFQTYQFGSADVAMPFERPRSDRLDWERSFDKAAAAPGDTFKPIGEAAARVVDEISRGTFRNCIFVDGDGPAPPDEALEWSPWYPSVDGASEFRTAILPNATSRVQARLKLAEIDGVKIERMEVKPAASLTSDRTLRMVGVATVLVLAITAAFAASAEYVWPWFINLMMGR